MERINAMTIGDVVLDWTPSPEIYKNDNIHPCVRYIPEGFAGHKWWMCTTPYPLQDSSVENPILYYGDSETSTPPTSWLGGVVVEGSPSKGYNSDCNLFYDGTRLWVFWRENYTPDTSAIDVFRAVFGKYTLDGTTFSDKKLFCKDTFSVEGKNGDTEMCPCVAMIGDKLKMYATHYEFLPTRQPYGLAIWGIENNDLMNHQFVYEKTTGLLYKKNFNFWHFDMFQYDGKYYCVTSPELGNEILLGVSDDGVNFNFWNTPLISQDVAKVGYYYYKPTAMVIDGILYLWHPVRIGNTSKIYMDFRPMSEVLQVLNDSISNM